MAWTSSAARSGRARQIGATLRTRTDAGIADLGAQGWLRLATLLHLSLLAAAIPLGSEIGIVVLTAGSAITLLILHRDGVVASGTVAMPGYAGEPDTDAQPVAETTMDRDLACEPPVLALPCPASRPADIVWRDIMGQISHELRTPLNAIIGFSDLMGRELYGPVGDPRYQEYLGHIRDSGRSLLKSAEDTLTLTELLAHRGDLAPSVVDVEDLILGALARAAAGSTAPMIRFDRHEARGVDVQGERRALHQSLLNVLAEAFERAGTEQPVRIGVREAGSRVVIDVRVAHAVTAPGTASLRMFLARMMLELNGAALDEATAGSDWRATVALDLVRQPDLFRT